MSHATVVDPNFTFLCISEEYLSKLLKFDTKALFF
jgi:hypothetical protein